MAEVAYWEVWQSEALVYRSRGYAFRKNSIVRVTNRGDIEAFKTDGILHVREVPLTRQKVVAPKAEAKVESTGDEASEAEAIPKAKAKTGRRKTKK